MFIVEASTAGHRSKDNEVTAPTAAKLTSAWDTLRHDGSGWPLFLTAVEIDGIRGWAGESIEFRYPVVAIAGVNGAGKSTVLKVAAAAYQAPTGGSASTYYPDDFFPKTPWDEVAGVTLTYTLRQGKVTETRAVKKPSKRWRGNPERKERPTFFLDISRIQPANTQIGYGRTAQEVISRGTAEPLSTTEVSQLSRALGRNYDNARIERSFDKQVGVLTHAGAEYSNFHQGAGEDSLLDLIALVSAAPDKSLIIIDEVEASLHPQAQRGLVTELLRLAFSKKLQIIVSTHSPFILEQLPPIARVHISVDRDSRRKVLYGISADFALNLMDDERHEELDVYCEDQEAVYLIERILALGAPEALSRVKITPVGPASAVIALAPLAWENKLSRKAICVVDADQQARHDYMQLPGSQAPEREIFDSLTEDNWVAIAERLGRPSGDVLDAKERATLIENHHAWAGEMARAMGGTMRTSKVWEAIADVWVIDVLGKQEAEIWCERIDALLKQHR